MVPLHMIEELADLAGRDDPEVERLVETANMFPESRDSVYGLLQVKLKSRGVSMAQRHAFGTPTALPGEGGSIGNVMVGGTAHGDCRFPHSALPGNVGIFGGSGTGKSSLVSLLCERWIESGLCTLILDVEDEYGWLIHRFTVGRLLVITARNFPLGIFVNPVGSCLSPLSWLALVVTVLSEATFLRDGSCNLLLKVVGTMYRERGVLEGSRDYPLATEVFVKLVTSKFSAASRHSGFLESLVNRFHMLLQAFPGMNAKRSLVPEQVTGRSLIIRMGDLSPQEIEVFSGLMLAWLMAYREAKI